MEKLTDYIVARKVKDKRRAHNGKKQKEYAKSITVFFLTDDEKEMAMYKALMEKYPNRNGTNPSFQRLLREHYDEIMALLQ